MKISYRKQGTLSFYFQDVTYTGCTANHSENGNHWCAYEVDENGVAVDKKWGDCNDACPYDGEEAGQSQCDETTLFNLGKLFTFDSSFEVKLVNRKNNKDLSNSIKTIYTI